MPLPPIAADPTEAGRYGRDAPLLRLALHQSRVGAISRLIALKLGFSPNDSDQINEAAALHDIGKLFVPVSYLEKAGPLAPYEMEAVRQHPQRGHATLSGSSYPTLRLAALVALQHHENWDGTGYARQRGARGYEEPYHGRRQGGGGVGRACPFEDARR